MRLCPRGPASQSDSVGKIAGEVCAKVGGCGRRFYPPYT